MLKAIFTALVLLAPFAARAGDPCPIPVQVIDLGAPEWLDRPALLAELESAQTWLGISYRTEERGLYLTRIHPRSPAETAGLQAGDLLLSINGQSALEDGSFAALHIGAQARFEVDRNGQVLALPLTVAGTDPVPLAILHWLEKQDCRAPALTPINAEARAAVMARLFSPNRRFRCEDAHLALRALYPQYQSDMLFVLRGRHRLLLTMPYSGSTCLSVQALDGARLTDGAIAEAVIPVISAYLRDRHENP